MDTEQKQPADAVGSSEGLGGVVEKRACRGGATIACRSGPEHGQRCHECKTWVRDDMAGHPFFGFAAGCGGR